ncbi:DHHW family protein [Clostridium nigeriense]|uniref:DHHW family protein n=1 Tax=Clostridium nigeriense TaxID=1805470 RepID=UPI003D328E59
MIQILKKIKKYPMTIFFTSIIIIFTALDVFNKDITFSEYENRSLAQKPKFYYSSFIEGRFFNNYDRYINDQFIFRDKWINIKSISENILGKKENNNVVYGKKDFLFDKFQNIDKDNLSKNISIINSFISKYDSLNFNLMIIPESFTIYKDFLPYGIKLVDEERYINSIYSEFDNFNNVKSIDIVESLKHNKDSYIYYRTDHHWTSYGAYLAYLEYCKQNSILPIDINNLKKNTVTDFYGTYFSKSKKMDAKADRIDYYDIDNIEVFVDNLKVDNINDDSKWSSSDKYSAFLKGNNAITLVKNNNKNDNSKILIIKDSYANSFIQFIVNNYKETYIVDLRSFGNNFNDFFEGHNFDNVIIMYNLKNISEDLNISKLKY